MYDDIIGLLVNYLNKHNLPGYVSDTSAIKKEDFVYKLQSYNFIYNTACFTQLGNVALRYLYFILFDAYNRDYCVCVNLNQLQFHYVVIDLDLKNATDRDYVYKLYHKILTALSVILGGVRELNFKVTMFVKLKSVQQQIDDHEIDEVFANQGIHFEIRDCVIYRGDNIWLVETLRKFLINEYSDINSIVDSPTNWCLPYSKKLTKEMYLPVREYTLNDTISYKFIQPKFNSELYMRRFARDFCIVKHYNSPRNLQLYFPLISTMSNNDDTENIKRFARRFGVMKKDNEEGGGGGVSADISIYKSFKLAKISDQLNDDNVVGLISVDRNSMPHINYAITRFYSTKDIAYVIGTGDIENCIHPFTIEFIREQIESHLNDWLLKHDQKALAIFNLYVFLVTLYDFVNSDDGDLGLAGSGGVRFADLILEDVDERTLLVKQFKQTSHSIKELVNQTCNKWIESKNNENVRSMNPILFLKCLLVQTYSDSNRCKFLYDDSTAQWIYISRQILDMVELRKLSILDFTTLLLPVYALQRDCSIIYYERNRWITALRKLEHMFLPSKILREYGHLLNGDDDGYDDDGDGSDLEVNIETVPTNTVRGNSSKKRNKRKRRGQCDGGGPQQQQKLYTHLIKFWGRVDILEFPSNVISFNDGFVLITNNYTFFHHTPLFRGQSSNLSWKMLNPIINHVNSNYCTHPDLLEMLIPSVEYPTVDDSGIIDYFRYDYKKEDWQKLDIERLKPCKIGDRSVVTTTEDNVSVHCPVYETLKYMLTLFSGDIELVFFMLWTLRYALLGISIKKVLIFYGAGNNGKSTFSNVLRVLYGSSMSFLSQETIGGKVGTTLCPDLFQAKRAKIVYVDDLIKINPASLKQLVSGAYLYIRTLYNAGESVQMKALLTGSTNSLTFNLDFASMKRLFIIPFTNFFSDDSNYYCNNKTYEILATNMLGTIFWIDRFADTTNIFYNKDLHVFNPPKSIKYFSHQSVWKNDVTNTFLLMFNLKECPGSFIRIEDLVYEINLLKGVRSSKFQISSFFNDVDAVINLLKHRYNTGKVLNKAANQYEDAIYNLTMEKYKLLYDRTYEIV